MAQPPGFALLRRVGRVLVEVVVAQTRRDAAIAATEIVQHLQPTNNHQSIRIKDIMTD